ncbi:MAG: hypothetical protein IT385_04900 [Deltaproteobacteria bacterium]|nr:hypothetical protein [Deltaproteobacteria bacterium]
MRARSPLLPIVLSLGLAPACWPSEEEVLADEAREALATPDDEVELPGRAADGAPVPAPLPPDDPTTTLTWALDARRIELEAERVDGVTTDRDALVVAVARAGDGVLVRLAPEGAAGTRVAAERVIGPLGPEPIALARAAHGSPPMALWVDEAGAVRAIVADERLQTNEPTTLLEPADGPALGHPVVAPADGGAIACIGGVATPLRCAMLSRAGALMEDGWRAVGKAKGMRAEALVESDNGWLLVAASCKPKAPEPCRRKDLVVIRLDLDGVPPKKRPTLPLPELQAARGGLLLVPEATGFVLVGRRVGAGEASAWRVTERDVKELDGKWGRVVGGLDHDDGFVFVEQAPLAMQDGFPVVRHRPRPFDKGKRGDPLAWPGSIAGHVPTGVDQRVISGEGLVAFVEPIRKQRARLVVITSR